MIGEVYLKTNDNYNAIKHLMIAHSMLERHDARLKLDVVASLNKIKNEIGEETYNKYVQEIQIEETSQRNN
jgi:hypothetical protein